MRKAVLLLFVALAASGSILSAQDGAADATPLIALGGVVVVDDGAGALLRRVRVEVSATGFAPDPVFTDDRGEFAVSVPDGPHTITFSKAGFVRRQLQRSTPAFDERLTVRMTRGAAISGRVVDEFGDPLLARVRLQRADWETIVATDPLGEFRVGSLPRGRYALTVVGGFPSLAQPDPQQLPTVVDVEAGTEAFASLRTAPLDFLRRAAAARPDAARAAEPADPGRTAVVRGRIFGPNGLPVGGASVTIGRTGETNRTTVSDGGGLFSFEGLPAGIYRLSAGKLGPSLFADSPDNMVTLRDGQVIDQMHLTMSHPPVISGVVTDEFGEPVEGITVQLWQPRIRSGRQVLMPSEVMTAKGRTDDRGRYRLFAASGTFYVVATDERREHAIADGGVRVYYPGTATLPDAQPIRSERGRDAAAIDIRLVAPATGRIDGLALDAEGGPVNAAVMLMERYWSRVPTPAPRTAPVDAAGRFSFGNVPPGNYVIHAVRQARGERRAEFGFADISIADGEKRSVIVRTTPGTTMTGRIVLEPERPDVELWRFGFSAQSDDGDFMNPRPGALPPLVGEDGTFEWAGLHGSLRVVGSSPPGWWLKSVSIGAFDASAQPYSFGGAGRLEGVVAVFADTAGEVTGRAVDRGEPVSTYAVLVFTTDRDRWSAVSEYVKVARPDSNGRFRALGLPPGDYLAIAVDRFDVNTEWPDPELLAELAPSARRVTVRERQQVTMDLDLIRRPR